MFIVCFSFQLVLEYIFFFFFSSRRRHTRLTCDWSSDVCSSDLLVALTKADLASPGRLQEVMEQASAALRGTPLDASPMMPVSVTTGRGVAVLLDGLVKAAAAPSARPVDARFRLAVDRVFTLPGIGVVVTGTVLSGAVRVEEHLIISPS